MSTDIAATRRPLLLPIVVAILVIAIGIAIVGGYAFGWAWTGFSAHETLWDLLHLLVLPIAVASVPIWFRTRGGHPVAWTVAIELLALALAVTLVGGYLLDWTWTGYNGQALWDWLELLVLPLALASLPVWFERRRGLTPLVRGLIAGALGAFIVLVFGGYVLDWEWTGFKDNTLWDWLGLLLVPFVVPAAVTWYLATSRVPTLRAEARSASQEPPA